VRLDQSNDIVRLAYELKVDLAGGAVEGIIGYCERKLRTWTREMARGALKAADLERLVARKLGLIFEEIWTDAELDQLIKRYVRLGEPVFATLKTDLNDGTFAALLERVVPPTPAERYVAVIDCRGEKAHRRFFSRWHEIAHLLTLTRQLELPFHRSCSDRSPVERLMDAIAGRIGFPDEIIRPWLEAERQRHGQLTFAGVERLRQEVCPEASFQATLNACVLRWPKPLLLIEAGMGLKNAERHRIRPSQLSLMPMSVPEEKLRVLVALSSDAARRTRFRMDKNMAVPCESAVYRAFAQIHAVEGLDEVSSTVEDLGIWRHSDGVAVGSGAVHVQVRPVGSRIVALIQR
jgi:hypothetical protein